MNYCIECGTKLIVKDLKNEGMIPYCERCQEYRFPIFSSAVSLIVVDRNQHKILLIKQYGRPQFILVAGYVTKGESVEETARRELLEETGLVASELHYNRSEYFEKSNTLMINFTVFVDDISTLQTNEEVDAYEWFSFEEAKQNIYPNSLAERFLLQYLKEV